MKRDGIEWTAGAITGVLVSVVVVILASLIYAGEPDRCCTDRYNLCGAAAEAADLLDEQHPARLKLIEARKLAGCE